MPPAPFLPLARRPIALPAAGILVCALMLGLVVRESPSLIGRSPTAEACAVASMIAALACGLRCRQNPVERLGWVLMAAALFCNGVLNAMVASVHLFPGLRGPWNVWLMIPALTSQVLMAAALLSWPWRRARPRRRLQQALGSVLFVGSLLVLLAALGIWGTGFQAGQMLNGALLVNAIRLSAVGGLCLYLAGENPRRARGVLGFVLAYTLVGGLYVALLQILLARGYVIFMPLVSLYALAPLLLALAAWSQAPVESSVASDPDRNWDLLPYGPFLLAGAAVLVGELRQGAPGNVPLMGFLALTGLLVLRQFLLLREVKATNASLEERVEARTGDLKTMQATLLRTERMNSMAILGAGLTHDLNNLLNAVVNSAQLLEEDRDAGRPAHPSDLARLKAASLQAVTLTGRLLSFGRRETDPPDVLLLVEELAHLEDLIRFLLPRSITLRMEAERGLFPVLSCRANLEQVLVNLVSNAKDAMPEGGTVTLRLDGVQGPGGPQVRIQVSDTGPGLAEDVRDHLFEPFYTTKGAGKGTGLGLASVKALVEGDGGTVALRTAPGEGCTFIITYPQAGLL